MVMMDASKRVMTMPALRQAAADIIEHEETIATHEERVDHLAQHLAGVIDAHCVLLQRALCIHCQNEVPLIFVEKWGEHLHNGELSCVASKAREVMGIDPATQHDKENYCAGV